MDEINLYCQDCKHKHNHRDYCRGYKTKLSVIDTSQCKKRKILKGRK